MNIRCLALLGAAVLATGCAQIIGIEDLPPPPPDAAVPDAAIPPDAPECLASTDCAATMPVCDTSTGRCKSCQQRGGNDACAMRDDTAPWCADDGTCVECRTSDDCTSDPERFICDQESRTCRGCEAHDECASQVCDRDSGACVPEDAIAYVQKEGGSDSAPCTKAQPCLTIDAALDQLRADNEAKSVVRILDGETYIGNLALIDITVRLVGTQSTIASDPADSNTAVINVSDNADVALEDLTIRGATGGTNADGIRCGSLNTPSTVRLLRVTARENGDRGVEVIQCSLTMQRSIITGNVGGGVKITDAAFDVSNSFLVSNGASGADLGGALVSNSTLQEPQKFAFNTVAENVVGSSALAGGVDCGVNPSSELIATSNIILEGLGDKPAVAGTCTWHYSNIENGDQLGSIASMDNGNLYDDCGLTGSDGVMSIAAGTPCEDAAEPDTGIDVDHEGDPRPQDAPDMGADELVSGS